MKYDFKSSQSTGDLLASVSDRFTWVFDSSRTTRTAALDIAKAFGRVQHAVLFHNFTNSRFMEIQVEHLALFDFFSVIDGLEWFFTTGLCNNICLLLKFFKALPMVLHLLYYTLMNFLMVLSVILTSILMILLPTVSVIRCLFCDNN